MLTRSIISLLDKARTFLEGKNSDLAETYQRDGFYKLAAAYSYGGRSYSGKAVSVETALESSAVYACVKIISEDMGGLPLFPFERTQDGVSVVKAYGNNLYRVLHDAPNPEMSSGEFREAMTAKACLGMDGFAKIERAKSTGQVAMLWPLNNVTVDIRRNKNDQMYYVVKDGNSVEKEYRREDIFHLKGFTFDGTRGDDIVNRARHAIGLTLSADEYAGRFFASDASPGLIIERPAGTSLNTEQTKRFKEAWKLWHLGTSRAHEPALLQDGMKAMRLDPDHTKLQMHETRKEQVIETARIYRVPLHKLANLDHATFSNIEHQGLEYVQHTLGPWRRRWEEAIHRCLFTASEQYWGNGRPRMFAEFNVEALVRGDYMAQSEGFSKGLLNGYYSINDVRAFLNMNPVEGGDKYRVQMQMQDITKTAAEILAEQGKLPGQSGNFPPKPGAAPPKEPQK